MDLFSSKKRFLIGFFFCSLSGLVTLDFDLGIDIDFAFSMKDFELIQICDF